MSFLIGDTVYAIINKGPYCIGCELEIVGSKLLNNHIYIECQDFNKKNSIELFSISEITETEPKWEVGDEILNTQTKHEYSIDRIRAYNAHDDAWEYFASLKLKGSQKVTPTTYIQDNDPNYTRYVYHNLLTNSVQNNKSAQNNSPSMGCLTTKAPTYAVGDVVYATVCIKNINIGDMLFIDHFLGSTNGGNNYHCYPDKSRTSMEVFIENEITKEAPRFSIGDCVEHVVTKFRHTILGIHQFDKTENAWEYNVAIQGSKATNVLFLDKPKEFHLYKHASYSIGEGVFSTVGIPQICSVGSPLKIVAVLHKSYNCVVLHSGTSLIPPKYHVFYFNDITKVIPAYKVGDIIISRKSGKNYEVEEILSFDCSINCWQYKLKDILNGKNKGYISDISTEFMPYISQSKLKALGVNEAFLSGLNKYPQQDVSVNSNTGRSTCAKCGKPTTDLALLTGTTKYCKDCDF